MASLKGLLKQYKGGIKQAKQLTTESLQKMSRNEKIVMAYRTSDALRKNVANIQKQGLTSPFIERRIESGKGLPKALSLEKLNKMTDSELNKTLTNLSFASKTKTSTVSGAKSFAKRFKEKTGVQYNDISPQDWENIRREIESLPYTSDEVIEAYFEADDNDIENYLQNNYDETEITEDLPF